MHEDSVKAQIVLIGKRILDPEYKEQEVDEYRNNPCIEALPPIFDDSDITDVLLKEIQIEDEQKNYRANVKYHYVNRVKDYFLPLDCHYKLEHTLSSMIRRGYIARNPASKEFIMRINLLVAVRELSEKNKDLDSGEVCRILAEKFTEIPETQRSTAECASLIGVSGEGKSVSIEKLLLMYPQVIHHYSYKKAPLTRTQVAWIKIDCPFDGSLKTLCKMFFDAMDVVLGNESYYKSFGNNRNSTATMMILMAHLASIHSVGVLVIDEIQHLIHPSSKPDDLLNFFVTLVNTIGVSILFIGTPKVWDVLGKGLRNIRRFTESGCGCWYRRSETDDEWNYLVEVMWEYQWLKNYTPLTDSLRKVLYFHSQGIIAVVKVLFILAQKQAIFDGSEKLTEKLLNETAEDDLKPLQKLMEAIRNSKTGDIEDYEDVEININALLEDQHKKANLRMKMQEASQRKVQSIREKADNIKDIIVGEVAAFQVFKNLNEDQIGCIVSYAIKQVGANGEISEIKRVALSQGLIEDEKVSVSNIKAINDKGKTNQNMSDCDLRKLFIQSKKEKKHIYDILDESRFIKDPFNDFIIYGVNEGIINLV